MTNIYYKIIKNDRPYLIYFYNNSIVYSGLFLTYENNNPLLYIATPNYDNKFLYYINHNIGTIDKEFYDPLNGMFHYFINIDNNKLLVELI